MARASAECLASNNWGSVSLLLLSSNHLRKINIFFALYRNEQIQRKYSCTASDNKTKKVFNSNRKTSRSESLAC